jgi:threonylcarbamoyladenosine tRNA methylthiotransferase MtaB
LGTLKIYLDSVGCRLNQSEIERYAQQFRLAGHELVGSADLADLVVVNTCDVTAAAASDSRQKIRQIWRASAARIILTGCWSTLHPESARALPGVTNVVPNIEKDWLVSQVLQISPEAFDQEFLEREPIPGNRLRTRAFIKVQDGCDNRCTYCVTTLARGSSRSRQIPEVIGEIQAALRGGAQEVVLTGVHLGSWGEDFTQNACLADLVKAVLEHTKLPRLRLSSLEPWDINESFFGLWENPRLCRHLHLPLQSGSAATLRRMARKVTPDSYARLLETARTAVPEVAITTDVIVGFPGENDDEFNESMQFIEKMHFAGGHVFTYSARPGTAAASMPDQVPHTIRKERNARMRWLLEQAAHTYAGSFLGKELMVLWESVVHHELNLWVMSGLSDNYLRINAKTPRDMWNQVSSVQLTDFGDGYLQGVIL